MPLTCKCRTARKVLKELSHGLRVHTYYTSVHPMPVFQITHVYRIPTIKCSIAMTFKNFILTSGLNLSGSMPFTCNPVAG